MSTSRFSPRSIRAWRARATATASPISPAASASGYAYAVEFLELDLGDVDEKRIHAGETNRLGFHGAAILSDVTLARPFLIRLEARGDWFDGSRHEPRVGGTIALGAIVAVAGVPVVMVSIHLESHCDPVTRCDDTEHLLAVLERIDPAAPVILGGDFNTSTASHAERHDQRCLARQPRRRAGPAHPPAGARTAVRTPRGTGL